VLKFKRKLRHQRVNVVSTECRITEWEEVVVEEGNGDRNYN
jgi:hypothetical protein